MTRVVRLCLVLMTAVLGACVSIEETPLAPASAESLRGRVAAIAVRDTPDFSAFTPGRAAIGGLIGGAMMIELGNRVVRENGVEDPSTAIARALANELKERFALGLAPQTVHVTTDDVAPLVKQHPDVDLLLDVRTLGWMYAYFPTAWNRYWVGYSARLRLIDVKRGQVIAEGGCARKPPEDSSAAPSGDELLANSAQRLKAELADAAQFCLQHFRTAPFAFTGPAASIAAATPAEGQPPASAPRTGAARVESAFWESIRASVDPADFQTYLEQFPNGMYAQAARDRLAALQPTLKPAVAAQPKSSAGPLPQVGDTWTYRLREPSRADGPKERSYVVKVAAADPRGIVEHYAVDGGPAGEWTHKGERELLGLGKSVLAPYLLAFGELPSSLGRLQIRDCGLTYICEATARVIGWEKVKVPAGLFDALKVEVRQEWRPVAMMGPQGAQLNGGRNLYVWYSRETKRAVKFSSRATFGEVPPIDPDFELELSDYRLN